MRVATTRPAAINMASGNDAVTFGELDGKDIRVAIIRARWHSEMIDSLVDGCMTSLKETGVVEEDIFETEVPGSFELPLAARYIAMSGKYDAVICIGVLIKGETIHFELISEAATDGLMQVGLSTGTPIILGVLTAMNEEQAKARSFGDNNHGLQWGKAAVEMALLRRSALGKKDKKSTFGFGTDDITPVGGSRVAPGMP